MKLWQFMKVELLGGDDGDSVKNKMLKKVKSMNGMLIHFHLLPA